MAYTIQSGDKLDYTCTGAVSNGELKVIGNTVGMALTAGTTGDLIAMQISGVVSATKDAGASSGWAVGGRVYYMTTGSTIKLTGVAAAGAMIGTGFVAATTGATSGTVKLNGGATVLETQT